MSQLNAYIADTSAQYLNPLELSRNDKLRLVKEIGRLRVQLYQAKFEEKSKQRSEFLRNEINSLKFELSLLSTP